MISLQEFIDWVEGKHKKDVSILIVWDKETNSTQILTQGSSKLLAERAALYGNNIAAELGLTKNDSKLVEDLRHRHENNS